MTRAEGKLDLRTIEKQIAFLLANYWNATRALKRTSHSELSWVPPGMETISTQLRMQLTYSLGSFAQLYCNYSLNKSTYLPVSLWKDSGKLRVIFVLSLFCGFLSLQKSSSVCFMCQNLGKYLKLLKKK